jgi:hypothetical protein
MTEQPLALTDDQLQVITVGALTAAVEASSLSGPHRSPAEGFSARRRHLERGG